MNHKLSKQQFIFARNQYESLAGNITFNQFIKEQYKLKYVPNPNPYGSFKAEKSDHLLVFLLQCHS